jgi:hypothetical protein
MKKYLSSHSLYHHHESVQNLQTQTIITQLPQPSYCLETILQQGQCCNAGKPSNADDIVMQAMIPSIISVTLEQSWNDGPSRLINLIQILLSKVRNMFVVDKVCKIEVAMDIWFFHHVNCHYNDICVLFLPFRIVTLWNGHV